MGLSRCWLRGPSPTKSLYCGEYLLLDPTRRHLQALKISAFRGIRGDVVLIPISTHEPTSICTAPNDCLHMGGSVARSGLGRWQVRVPHLLYRSFETYSHMRWRSNYILCTRVHRCIVSYRYGSDLHHAPDCPAGVDTMYTQRLPSSPGGHTSLPPYAGTSYRVLILSL